MEEKEVVASGVCSFVMGRETVMSYKASICFPLVLYSKKLEFYFNAHPLEVFCRSPQ